MNSNGSVNRSEIDSLMQQTDEEKLRCVQNQNLGMQTSGLLIFSLHHTKPKKSFLDPIFQKYTSIGLPKSMTIGTEIEMEGEAASVFLNWIPAPLPFWESVEDMTLKSGVEIRSKILKDKPEDLEEIYYIYKMLDISGLKPSERCGGHIHIGSDYLTTNESYLAFEELIGNTEKLLFLIANAPGELPREGIKTHAFPQSRTFEVSMQKGEFDRNIKYIQRYIN